MKKQKQTGHMMGKRCGYHLLADGSISIAPQYNNQFMAIQDQRVAADSVLAAVTRQCAELEKISAKQSRLLWDDVLDDYGLSRKDGSYQYVGEGIITFTPNPKVKGE